MEGRRCQVHPLHHRRLSSLLSVALRAVLNGAAQQRLLVDDRTHRAPVRRWSATAENELRPTYIESRRSATRLGDVSAASSAGNCSRSTLQRHCANDGGLHTQAAY